MNRSIEEILRESREKRRKTLEIRKVQNSNDVEMKNYDGNAKKERNFERRKKVKRRFDHINNVIQNKFKKRRVKFFLNSTCLDIYS